MKCIFRLEKKYVHKFVFCYVLYFCNIYLKEIKFQVVCLQGFCSRRDICCQPLPPPPVLSFLKEVPSPEIMISYQEYWLTYLPEDLSLGNSSEFLVSWEGWRTLTTDIWNF